MQSPLKILFIDDHEGLRDGIGILLTQKNPNFNFIYASNSTQAIDLLKKNTDITLAIVDINLDGEDGLLLIPQLREIIANLNVLVYSMYNDALHIGKAIEANIQGYVTKNSKCDELEKAIYAINEGSMFYTKRAAQLLHTMIQKDTAIVDDDFSASIQLIENYKTLTKKEQEIFMLLAQGKTTVEVAQVLKKTDKTVRNQRSFIYSKLQLKDRLDLINAARILGIIV